MKKFILATGLVAAVSFAGAAIPGNARAGVATPPVAMQDAIRSLDFKQDVRYVCRRVWRCNRWGHRCHWDRRCWWEPSRWRHHRWESRRWRYRHR